MQISLISFKKRAKFKTPYIIPGENGKRGAEGRIFWVCVERIGGASEAPPLSVYPLVGAALGFALALFGALEDPRRPREPSSWV